MDERARRGTVDDLAVVLDLLREGRTTIADARGGAMWLRREAIPEPLDEAVGALLESADADAEVVVGTIDDVVLGVLLARVVEDDHGRVADIAELFVTPEARGVGLGEHMMNHVLEWAAAAGCGGVSGRALPGDRATKNHFETFGLVARSIEVFRAAPFGDD